MSIFDLIILAILAALTLRGIWKGMISQIVSVISFFICWIVASQFGSLFAPTIPLEAPWNQVAAMAVIFIITMVAIRFAHAALEKIIKNWHLAKLNSLLGGLLGFTKGLLICLIITFFSVMLSETSRSVVFNSQSGIHLVHVITKIRVFVPGDSYEFVHNQLDQFQEKVDKSVPGQIPKTLPVQSSGTVQRMLAQVQSTKEKSESSTGSFLAALSKWWNPKSGNPDSGNPDSGNPDTPDTGKPTPDKTLDKASDKGGTNTKVYSPAVTFPAPPPQVAPLAASVQKQGGSLLASLEQAKLATALPSIPEMSSPPSLLSSLPALAPLTELLPMSPESEMQHLPVANTPHHVGSDLLLRNSAQATKPDSSAKVFRISTP